MKQLSLRRILWVILFFGLTLIVSCDKEESTKPDYLYYNLTPEQIAQSPYFAFNKYDTLSFFNTKGDTFTFGKIKTDTAYREGFHVDVGSGHETYYFFQYLHNTYQTLKGDGRFEVWHKYITESTNMIEANINYNDISYPTYGIGKDISIWPFYEVYSKDKQVFNKVTYFNSKSNLMNFFASADDGLVTIINTQTNDTLQLIKK